MIIQDKVKKGLSLIMADFFGLAVGLLNGFFLPLVFTIEGYALFRQFTLYATFAVFFSFGLSDGLYLLHGGKDDKSICRAKTRAYYIFLMKMQGVVFILLFLLSRIIHDTAFTYFTIFIFPVQLINFFRLYYRATGEFEKYSKVQAGLVALELLDTLLIIFCFRSDQPNLFLTIKIVNHFIVAGLLTFFIFKNFRGTETKKLSRADYTVVLKPGMTVLLADLLAALLFSLDRWVVMALFSTENFAYYAFAISIMNLFIILITSITNIFYSYISKKAADENYLTTLKKYVVLISSFFPSAYFVLSFIIARFLPGYVLSLDILGILLMTLPYISVINIIYINTYKASGKVKLYTGRMAIVLPLFLILDIIAVMIFSNLQTVAVAMLLGFIIWYLYSSRDFTATKITKPELFYLLITQVCFIFICAAGLHWLISLALYLVILLICLFILYRSEFTRLMTLFRNQNKCGGN